MPDLRPANERPDITLRRQADEICRLIRTTDYTRVDILIKINGLREWCRIHIPERRRLFDMIYASRFERLWAQFRTDEEELDVHEIT